MSKPTPTELFYCGLLESLDVDIGGKHDNLLYAYEDDGSAGPIRVKGKSLVIPSRANLKQAPEFWNTHIAFHPLNEQVLRDDSEVLKTLQRLINWKTIKTLSYLAFNLTLIASHPELIKKLNPRQHILLDALRDANKKTAKFVKEITDASFSGNVDHRLIKTFIKKGGIYKDKKNLSLIITRFSMFENGNINLDNRTILGVKAPKISDLDAIPELFKLILPNCDVPESYNVPSNDEIAPRLHSLLGGYVMLARRFNEVLKLFGSFIEDSEFQHIDLSWVGYLDKFLKLRYDVPPLDDNYGDIINPSKTKDQSSKNLRTTDNIDESGSIVQTKSLTKKDSNIRPKTYLTNPNRNKNADPINSYNGFNRNEDHGQQSLKSNASRSTKTMNPLLMMNMMNNNNGEGNEMDPMMMSMLMGGKIDPMMLMMMNKDKEGGGGMDPMMMSMMMNQDNDNGGGMDPMMMSMLMNKDSDGGGIDPMMLMMMNQNKDKDSDGGGIDPMMLMMMNQNKEDGGGIDPMQLAMMSGGKIDPMLMMMMNKDKEGGGEMDPMMMSMMMGGKIDPMMLMMMNQNKEGGGEIDPMQLAMMSGGKIDPMMLMMMNQNKKAKKGQTHTPKQPSPKKGVSYPTE